MDFPSDPQPIAFDFSEDFYEEPAEARPDANTTLLSLPTEILLEITQYCKFADIYSLTTVNRILHAVSIERFYSVVAINTHRIISTLINSPGISENSSITDMLPLFNCPASKILRGLLAQKRHLQSLRTLILCNAPHKSLHYILTCTIMREIVSNATGLVTLRLPSTGSDAPVDFAGITRVIALQRLELYFIDSKVSQAVLQYIGSLTSLHVTHVGHEFLDEPHTEDIYGRITKFSCTWVFDISREPEPDSFNEKIGQRLPQLLPNLQDLSVAFSRPGYLHQYYEDLNKQLRENCDRLVQGLKSLKYFTMWKITELTSDFRGSAYLNEEVGMLKRFASLRPGLLRVTIHNHNPVLLFNCDYINESSVTWKRVHGQSTDAIWTPDPAVVSRWTWWFGMFGHVTDVREKMVNHWKGESVIPSLERLKMWEEDNAYTIKHLLRIN